VRQRGVSPRLVNLRIHDRMSAHHGCESSQGIPRWSQV
jgi:hypothetical protein